MVHDLHMTVRPTLRPPQVRETTLHHVVESDDIAGEEEEDVPDVPIYLSENPKYKPRELSKDRHYLCVKQEGGLGNSMFAYASLWGISHKNHMKPTWSAFQLLRNYFHLNSTEMTEDIPPRSWSLFLEDGASVYDDRTEELNYDLDIVLLGFYQSWKYFESQKAAIRQHFSFREEILVLGRGYLTQAYEESYGLANIPLKAVTYIGVHIRRGDMLHSDTIKKGFTVATVEYLEAAMVFFASRHRHPLFVVCSDDIPWSRHHVPRTLGPVAFSSERYAVEDLAILSLCNHTIITVGTFGWWAGWLAGGTVLYYADFPARGSALQQEFNPKDFYPPRWKGLSFRVKNS